MTQHKWHKEIKAWADGAEIEFYHSSYAKWVDAPDNPDWSGSIKYRIKPQPKEPQYLYIYQSNSNDYIFDIGLTEHPRINPNLWTKIGKIKLEVDDADQA